MNWMSLDGLLPKPAVSIGLIDIVTPRSVCFDVGSHHGYLSVIMSRLTGPTGQVCAFEANRHTVPQTIAVLNNHRCNNVWLTHAAVFDQTGVPMPLYECGHGGDSVVMEREGVVIDTPRSLALDDFCDSNDIWPDFVKFDIEGAEIHALRGAPKMLSRAPVIIVEMSSSDTEIFPFLRTQGYERFIDLNNYDHVNDPSDFRDGGAGAIRNVLCIPENARGELPAYCRAVHRTQHLDATEKQIQGDGQVFRSPAVHLSAGRYVSRVQVRAEQDQSVHYRVVQDGNAVVGYTGPVSVFASHYCDLPFHLYEAGEVQIEFSRAEDVMPRKFRLESVRIEGVAGMADAVRPLLL